MVNFFWVLRERKEELIEAIGLTHFSREEFELAVTPQEEDISDLERARRFFIRARQSRTGLAQTASLGRWLTVSRPHGGECQGWFLVGLEALRAYPK